MHHPLDWLHDIEKNTIEDLLTKKFHMIINGHTHKPNLTIIDDIYLPYTINLQNTCIYEKPKYFNGYVICELRFDENKFLSKFMTYFPDRNEYDIAINLCKNGTKDKDIMPEIIAQSNDYNGNNRKFKNLSNKIFNAPNLAETNNQDSKDDNSNTTYEDIIKVKFERISLFYKLKKLTPEHMMNIIDPTNKYCYLRYNELIITDKELCTAIGNNKSRKSLVSQLGKELRSIFKFLANSGILSILANDNNYRIDISKYEEKYDTKIDEVVADFNFIEAENLLDKMNDNSYDSLIRRSRISLDIGKADEAFNLAHEAESIASNNKDFTSYCLAIYNQKRIFGHMWTNALHPYNHKNKRLSAIDNKENIFNLDINEKYIDFFEDNNSYEQLKYFLTINNIYSNKVMHDYIFSLRILLENIHQDRRNILKDKMTMRNPKVTSIAEFYLIIIIEFIQSNNIIYDYTKDNTDFFRLFCEAYFVRHQIDLYLLEKGNEYSLELKEINYYTLHLAIRYFYKDSLADMFDRIDLEEIKISADTQNELITAFNNLLKFISTVKWRTERLIFIEYFINNFILLFQKTNIRFEKSEITSFTRLLIDNNVDKKIFQRY